MTKPNERDLVYTTKEWRAFRARMMKQLEPYCIVCNKELVGNDFTLDHIVPVSKHPELMYEPTNIQPMCRYHNSMKRDLIDARIDYFNPKYVSKSK